MLSWFSQTALSAYSEIYCTKAVKKKKKLQLGFCLNVRPDSEDKQRYQLMMENSFNGIWKEDMFYPEAVWHELTYHVPARRSYWTVTTAISDDLYYD